MIDEIYLKAHCTAASLRLKKGRQQADCARQRWHEYETARCCWQPRTPHSFFMSAGQISDYTGAKALVGSLPSADWLLGVYANVTVSL